MISTVLRYEIETIDRDKEKLEWKLRTTITPNYKIIDRYIEKKFLFWTWQKHFDVIENERVERIKARRKAFKIAKRLYPEYAVRVFIVFKFPEVDESIRHRVWENGYYYSTH